MIFLHNPIKQAFEPIVAEEALKMKTILAIYSEKGRVKCQRRFPMKRWLAVASSFFLLFVAGSLSFRIYYTPAATVNIDTNPAIELLLNRFDTVVGVYSYNEDGENLLQNINLKYQKCDKAVEFIVDKLALGGYLSPEGLLSVTVQTENIAKEKALLMELNQSAKSAMISHHAKSEMEIYPVSSDISSHAHNLNISPAKYLAITELQKIDQGVTVETCKNHSIKELRDMAQDNEIHTHQAQQTPQHAPESAQKDTQEEQSGHNHGHRRQNCKQ